MKTFRDHLTDRELSTNTANAYIVDVGLFAAWYKGTYGERLTGTFTPTDVREYRAHLLNVERAAPATVNRRLAALRAYGAYLVATGQAESNPAEHARGVKQQKAAPKWLDGKEQARLTRELEKDVLAARTISASWEALRNQAIVVLLLNTGLRVAELCALDHADVTLGPRSGRLIVRNGKGEKRRELPLNLGVRAALERWYEQDDEADEDRGEDAPLFTGRTGQRLEPRGVQKMVAELGRRAKVEDLTPHSLRHTFAKNLINTSVSIEKVAALMGHSSLSTTALYTVPDARDLAQAVANLED